MNKKALIATVTLFILSAIIPAQEMLDGIAATVDDRIILYSEVESQLQILLMQSEMETDNEAILDSLRKEIVQQMIDDKLVLIEAERDTTIEVTSTEIEDALNQHITRIKNQFPSEDAFIAQLTAEGLTLKELRARYKDEVKNQIYKERFLNKHLQSISISSGEVKEFYESFNDSLPKRPAGVHLAHILINIETGQVTKDSVYQFAGLILQKVKAGEKFELLAKNYSSDVSASQGGDLGWFSRGDMVKSFEDVAFSLPIGETSDIVETQYGYHIIKCIDKKAERVHASHILFKFEPTEEDVTNARNLVDSLYTLLQEGANFDTLAMEYSDDQSSASDGGDLGWYAANDLSQEFIDAVSVLNEDEFSEPVLSQYGFHILKVIEKKESRPLDFTEDYSDIEAIAKRFKAQNELDKWLSQVKEKYYIEIKI